MERAYSTFEYTYLSGYHTAIQHRMLHKRPPSYQGKDKVLKDVFSLGAERAKEDEKLFRRTDMLEGARDFTEGRERESKALSNLRYAKGVELANAVLDEFRTSDRWSELHNGFEY